MKYWRKPLDSDRIRVPRGEVRILVERCKGCGFCVEYCPRGVLAVAESYNRKGYHPPEVVKRGACVSCSLCEMICPDFAIFSVLVAEAETDGAPAPDAGLTLVPTACGAPREGGGE